MIEDNPADEILTPEEVAVILGATQKTPLQMRCAQDGPADLKISPGPKGHVRYRRVDVDAFIALERKTGWAADDPRRGRSSDGIVGAAG